MLDLAQSAHAVIVGVEQYAGGSAWNLDGPVHDAVGYARRLLDGGLPPERITLLLSPLPRNTAAADGLGTGYRRATRDTVHEVLFRELPNCQGELFFLAWSGHGLVDARGGRRLLYADAVAEDLRSLDLDAALTAWRSDLIPSFPHQLWLVDACQVFADSAAVDGALRPDPVPLGRLRERPGQHAFFACAPGQSARNTATGGFGVFTSRALSLLDAGPHPDGRTAGPGAFAAALRDGVRATAAGDGRDQTPTYFWHAGPDGQGERWSHPRPTVPHPRGQGSPAGRPGPPAGAPALARPTREQRRRLLDILERMPAMAAPAGRSRLIRQLPAVIAVSVPQSGITRSALLDLIDTCVEFPGGLAELEAALDMVDSGTAALAEFRDALRELAEAR
ncbi:hypothetical protein ACH4UM_08215 [Streptomyces sp. NPDC020801]|uniref:effector-associated domain 2-containing protein n=1 Tax=unclassified Streptomyces TaxID=2593676 RepID=UPI00378C7661